MLFFTLTKKRLPDFLDAVDRHYRLIVPEQKGSKTYTFRAYSEFPNVALEFLRTIIPPRQFFFPPVERLFSVDKECRINVSPEDEPFSIIFGFHPCDLCKCFDIYGVAGRLLIPLGILIFIKGVISSI